MAIPAGHRFPITFDELFPQGFYVISVERANDYVEGKSKPAVCKLTGRPVWTVEGTPFRPATFTGLKVTPYVRDGWVNYTIWADEMHSALPANRGGKAAAQKSDASPAAA